MLIWSADTTTLRLGRRLPPSEPVVDAPAPLAAWRARERLVRAAMPPPTAILRAALEQAGLALPARRRGPEDVLRRVAAAIAAGSIGLVQALPGAIVIQFDDRNPEAALMPGRVLFPDRDAALAALNRGEARMANARALEAALLHPAGSRFQRRPPPVPAPTPGSAAPPPARPAAPKPQTADEAAATLDEAATLLARQELLLLPVAPLLHVFRVAWVMRQAQGGGTAPRDPPPGPAPPVPPPRPGPAPAPAPPPGELSVHVVREGGTPIKDAEVNVDGLGIERTDDQGWAHYGTVAPRGYNAKGSKQGFGKVKGGVFAAAEGSATVSSGQHAVITLTLFPFRIVSIAGSVPGTHGVRVPANKRPTDALFTSTVDDKSLTSNAPSIVVRGCNTIDLLAVTAPADQQVSWSIVATENSSATPSLTAGPKPTAAKLSTNKPGSFSVIGKAGENQIVWNVVFVSVEVDVASSVIVGTDANYKDGGSQAGFTFFKSGEFLAGQFAWQATVSVKLVGGGSAGTLGIDKVRLHVLQNGVADTLTGNYAPGETALEVPKGGLPVVDSNDASQPFVFVASVFKVTPDNTAAKQRSVFTADSPTGSFPRRHQNTNSLLTSISGINGFSTAIAATSTQAPNNIVVHAKTAWSADYAGTVNYGAPPGPVGTWVANGAHLTFQAAYVAISPGTGGQDAAAAGFETFQPRFNEGTNTTWTP